MKDKKSESDLITGLRNSDMGETISGNIYFMGRGRWRLYPNYQVVRFATESRDLQDKFWVLRELRILVRNLVPEQSKQFIPFVESAGKNHKKRLLHGKDSSKEETALLRFDWPRGSGCPHSLAKCPDLTWL